MLDREVLREKYGTEQVFAVPYEACTIIKDLFTPWEDPLKHGNRMKKDIFEGVLPYGKFMLRAEIEGDKSYQQIIPYVFITCGNSYYVSRRIKGDSRLQGKLSLGYGGHINPCDDKRCGCHVMIHNAFWRELDEETNLMECENWSSKEYGLVRDLGSSTPDHIGIVYKVKILGISARQLKVKETDTLEGLWMSEEELVQNIDKFESWAQYIIKDIAANKKAA